MSDEKDALEMIGRGYEQPAAVIEAPRKRMELRGDELVEVETPAWVKLSTAFKKKLAEVDESALKVWLFIALSVNSETQEAHPGIRTIAAGTGLDKETVVNAIKRLEETYNLLNVQRRGVKKVNLYRPIEYVSAGQAAPSVRNFRTDGTEKDSKSVRKFRTDLPENDESVRIEDESVRIKSVPNKSNKIKTTLSPETQRAVQSSPGWAILAGAEYVPDPEQAALEKVRETFDRILRINAPWERWSDFDKWLLKQERAGMPVEKFCKWFISNDFRKTSVGMWTPNGKGKQGEYAYKTVYPQAFPAPSEKPAQTPIPELRPFSPPPAAARAALRANLGVAE